jgi:synaptic vesicle membrane protein VAT-1
MPLLARRWSVSNPGDINNLVLEKHTLSDTPPPGTERVSVRACGLNFADVISVLGLYQRRPSAANPLTPGFEVAGTVIGGCPTVAASFPIGDRVWGIALEGAYASVVDVPAETLFSIPDDWSYTQAAAFPVQAFTAYYCVVILGGLDVGNGDAGSRLTSARKAVLVHSAAGVSASECFSL